MSDEHHMATLSAAEVARLLRTRRIAVRVGSPLLPFASVSAPLGGEPAGAGPLDDQAWDQALAVLAAPERQVRVIVPGPAETAIQVFYGSEAAPEAGLVGCWPEGDHLRLSFPWAGEDLVGIAANVLQTTTAPPAAVLDLTVSLGGLWALAAAVDELRARLFASLAERRPGVDARIDLAGIEREYEAGVAGGDARWLVTLLRVVAPSSAVVGAEALEAGLDELARVGLVRVGEGGWAPAPALLTLAAQWRSPLPAVAHEVIETSGGRVTRYGHRVAIRGDGPVTVLDFGGVLDGAQTVAVRGVDALGYLDGLVTFLRPAGEQAPVGEAAPPPIPTSGAAPSVAARPPVAAPSPGAAPPVAPSVPSPPAAGAVLSPPPVMAAPAVTVPRRPRRQIDVVALVAAAGLVLSALLPWAAGVPVVVPLWVPVIGSIPFPGSLQTPAYLLVTFNGSTSVLSIGLVMLLMGAAAVASVLVPALRRYAWVVGVVAVLLAGLWLVRMAGFGFTPGPWLALVAGTTLMVRGLRRSARLSKTRPSPSPRA